jgi:hypothetical protein
VNVRTRSLVVPAALAATLLLGGCGSSPLEGKTGPEVAAAAADALDAAGSVHVAGTMSMPDGQEGEVDLQLQGDDVLGILTIGGHDLQLIVADGVLYMQAPPEFWTEQGMPAAGLALLEGRWVKLPTEDAGGFDAFSLSGFTTELRTPSDGSIEDAVTTDGDVVVVRQEDGSTLNVADDDPAYPLGYTNRGDTTGTITFSRFGEKQDIVAPVNPLDLAALAGG